MTVDQDYRRNLIIGTFVLFGLLALGLMIVLFGESPQSFTRTYDIAIYFPSAGPVRTGDPVLLNGMEIGRITSVQPQADMRKGIKFMAAISSNYLIPVDAAPLIREQTLTMGRPAVRIEVGMENSDQTLAIDGTAVLQGEVAGGIEELIPKGTMDDLQDAGRSLTRLAKALEPVAEDLHQLLEPRSMEQIDATSQPDRPLANISTAIQRLDQTLKNFNAIVGDPENQNSLRAAIRNFEIISQRGIELVDAAKSLTSRLDNLTGKADQQVEQVGRSVMGLCDQLSGVLDNLASVSEQLASGQGSAGRFLRDPELYESLSLTSRRFRMATDDLRDLITQWQEKGLKIQGGLLGK